MATVEPLQRAGEWRQTAGPFCRKQRHDIIKGIIMPDYVNTPVSINHKLNILLIVTLLVTSSHQWQFLSKLLVHWPDRSWLLFGCDR